ncbi:hypothetical protein BDV27DRAFT_138640 [Aspergillus caelatus]|uniref:Uncharacterized protein n=1 Tax=Aspergillus caelatus TaxID=61420 RepID=A0A5N6ZKT4_9EURO|nr:uncharacterized protein BDV27DRAFT_138640 [Aspergillus caelatus]KAE8357823.1 hypothetical protein BDV27DRAFT_138640 [Aspergillus caelatus]
MARTIPRVYTEAERLEQQNLRRERIRQEIAKEKVAYARALSSSWPLASIPRSWKTEPYAWEYESLQGSMAPVPETGSIAHANSPCQDSQESSHDNPTPIDSPKSTSMIEALPLELLELIVRIALDLDEQQKPTGAPKVWEPYPINDSSKGKLPPGRMVSRTALPLILSCRTLRTITHAIILSHVQFWSPNNRQTDWLLTSLDKGSLLSRLRHVAINLDGNSSNTWDGKGQTYGDDECSYQLVANGSALLERLPDDLSSLSLTTQDDGDYSSYIYFGRIHPAFQQSLARLRNLRHLELDFYNQWLSLNLWCAKPPVSMTFLAKDVALPPPMFPNLRHLYLTGCLSESVTSEDVIVAFSQQQLPSLQSLVIDRLLYEDEGPPVFVPEVIKHMNPLREFSWLNYDFGIEIRRSLGDPHDLPMREHLEALKRHHGVTLELLTLNYNGEWGRPEYDFTEDYLKDFIKAIPTLNKVYIDIPGIGVKITVGPSTIDD